MAGIIGPGNRTQTSATLHEVAERIKRLEEDGIIRSRVALLDAAKINLGLTAFIAVRTAQIT